MEWFAGIAHFLGQVWHFCKLLTAGFLFLCFCSIFLAMVCILWDRIRARNATPHLSPLTPRQPNTITQLVQSSSPSTLPADPVVQKKIAEELLAASFDKPAQHS